MEGIHVFPLHTKAEVKSGDDIAALITSCVRNQCEILKDGDIIAVSHKIISKSEDRCVPLAWVTPGKKAQFYAHETGKDPRLTELILRESSRIVRWAPGGPLICRHRLGFVCANAGVDQSNSGGQEVAILLPENPDHSAALIRTRLMEEWDVELGVLVIDTQGRPFRQGAHGVTIGLSGVTPLHSYVGQKDRDGRELLASIEAQADMLSGAATLVIGQGSESTPVAVIRGFSRALGDGTHEELVIPHERDLFMES